MAHENIINYLKKLSNDDLKTPQDIEMLISIAEEKNIVEKLQKISFSGKFIYGLYTTLQQKNDMTPEALQRAKETFSMSILRFTKEFESFVLYSDNLRRDVLTKKYLLPQPETLTNILNLCNDLNYLKMYYIDNKASTHD